MPSSSLRFDHFELQPDQRRLLRDGEPSPLRARAFDLLLVLAERAGELVTKAELLDRVWPGLVVEENNIAAQVAALRKVVGAERIETVAGSGYRFTAEVRREAVAPPVAVRVVAATAGPSLIGRRDDLERLEAALQPGTTLTLLGPGGVGKTVLAKSLSARWPAGRVAWVDLAALGDAALLHGALRRALGLASSSSPIDADAALAGALDGGRLVILDNAEHLVDAVAALATTLRVLAPSLALLVTSQVPLRIVDERVQPVEPLALPTATANDAETVASPAVQLLVERIRAIDPRVPLDASVAPLLRQLSVRLDGLPLALEMAAAMVPLLGLAGVLDALDERFALLRRGQRDAPPRHQTLGAALAWSHDLLDAEQRRVFRRLGVFPSGFSLDLAIAVARDDEGRWAVIDALKELVDRSLVASLQTTPPRFRLLETMRGFALERLRDADEEDALRRRAIAALTDAMAAVPSDGAEPDAVAELANVPELLAWGRANAPREAIALTLAAAKVAIWSPWLGDAAAWVEDCEPLLDASIPLAMQAQWWRELARFQTFVRGRRAVEAAERACEIERERGDADGLFWSLIPLLRSRTLDADAFDARRLEAQALLDAHPEWPARARVVFSGSLALEYRRRGDFETAWRHQLDEAEQAERAGMQQVADNAHSNLAATLVGLRRFDEALARLDARLARSGDEHNPIGAHNRIQRLNALIGLGRLDEAQACADEALRWCRRYDVLDIFQVLALLAASQGRASVAARLLGYHRHRLAERGADRPDDAHAPWRVALGLAGRTLAPATLDALMADGARLDAASADRLIGDDADADASPRTRRA